MQQHRLRDSSSYHSRSTEPAFRRACTNSLFSDNASMPSPSRTGRRRNHLEHLGTFSGSGKEKLTILFYILFTYILYIYICISICLCICIYIYSICIHFIDAKDIHFIERWGAQIHITTRGSLTINEPSLAILGKGMSWLVKPFHAENTCFLHKEHY